MKGLMEVLYPHLADATKIRGISKGAISTVWGDRHDIGKNPVAMVLEGAGFEVTDVGVVAMSAQLTTTMPSVKNTLEVFRKAGMRDPSQSDDRRRSRHSGLRGQHWRGGIRAGRCQCSGHGEGVGGGVD